MTRYEKLTGLLIALLGVLGGVSILFGHIGVGLLAIIGVGGFAMFLAAQSLREVRRQRRTSELLREYLKMTRGDLSARLDNMEGEVKASSARTVSHLNELESSLLASMRSHSKSLHESQSVISRKVTAHQDGTRALVEVLRSELEAFRGNVETTVFDLDVRIAGEAERLTESVADVKARTLAAVGQAQAEFDAALVASVHDVQHDQRLLSAKTIALQDGLREMLGVVHEAQDRQQETLKGLRISVTEQGERLNRISAGRTLADLVALTNEVRRENAVSRRDRESYHRDILAEFETANTRELDARWTLQRHFDDRLDSELGTISELLGSLKDVSSGMEVTLERSLSGGSLGDITSAVGGQANLLRQLEAEFARIVDRVVGEVGAIVTRDADEQGRDRQNHSRSVNSAIASARALLQDVAARLVEMQQVLDAEPGDKLLEGIERAFLAQAERVEELRIQAQSIAESIDVSSTRGALEEFDAKISGLGRDVQELIAEGSALRCEISTRGDLLSARLEEGPLAPAVSMEAISAKLSELREPADGATLVESIDAVIEVASHREAVARTWRVLRAVQTSTDLSDAMRDDLLAQLYPLIGMQEVRQEFVLDVNRFDIGVSFRSQMVRLMLLKKRLSEHGYVIAPRLNDKLADREFARRLEIPAPSTIGTGVRTEDLAPVAGTVIKPSVGESANGVFYVRDDGSLFSLKSQKVYSSLAEATPEYNHLAGSVDGLTWIVEEAILDAQNMPARDFKVFMFYGRVGLYREILRGQGPKGSNSIATYDAQGRPTRYRATDSEFTGGGVPDGVVEMATKVSLASPVPFLRVDFLVGSEGPVLGEITPHPGGIYAGDAFDDIDRSLGAMYLDADARLTIDLLEGKRFDEYFEAYGVMAK